MQDYDGLKCQVPIGTSGLLSDMAPSQIPYTNLTRVYNCDFGVGYVEKAKGAIQYQRYALPAGIVAILDYWPTTLQQRLFAACSNGSIYRDTGDRYFGANPVNTSPVAIGSGFGTLTNKTQFVVGGNEVSGNVKKIFLFTGGLNQVQVYSGDSGTFSAITNPAADWPNPTISSNPQSNFPNFGLIHRGALWCFAKGTAYMSNPNNHEDFQTAQDILITQVGPGEGGDIVGAFVYKQKLFAWKEGDFCYILNDSDPNSSNWYFDKQSDGLGIASWHSACQVLDDMQVGNITNKITSYKATLNYGNFTQGDVFKQNEVSRFFAENTVPEGNQYQHSLFYPDKGVAMFTGRTKGQQNNNCIIQMDVSHTNQAPKFGIWNHVAPDCLGLRRNTHNIKVPMYGCSDGFVYLMDSVNRFVGPISGGTAYTGEFWTADLDMRHLDPKLADQVKEFNYLGVTFMETGNYTLSVDVWLDGRFRETLTFSQTVDTNYCGAFVLGTSRTGGLDEKTIEQRMHGQGRRITLRCYNSGNNQNFKVSLLTIGFKPTGDQQATRL